MYCLPARKESDSDNYSKANRLTQELIVCIKKRTKESVFRYRPTITTTYKNEKTQAGEKEPSE